MAYEASAIASAEDIETSGLDVTVDIGTGTDRKAVCFVFCQNNSNTTRTWSNTYDPGGDNGVMTSVHDTVLLIPGSAYYGRSSWWYDIPDGQSGNKTFRFEDASAGSWVRGIHGVLIYSGISSGAPEANYEDGEDFDPGTDVNLTTVPSITTIAANAQVVTCGISDDSGQADNGSPTSGHNQTERIDDDCVGFYHSLCAGDYVQPTAGSGNYGWDSTNPVRYHMAMILSFAPVAATSGMQLVGGAGLVG